MVRLSGRFVASPPPPRRPAAAGVVRLLAVLIIAALSPVQEALIVGTIYGAGRLVRTWRGSFPQGKPFADAMHRYGHHPHRTARLNMSIVVMLTVWLVLRSLGAIIH